MSFRFTSTLFLARGRRTAAGLASCLALLVSPAVLAQLTASGPIATDTRWTITDSPVQVTGDVVVDGGATLSIDPGVRVEFAADTSLTVRAGALYAVGTPSSKIVFTGTRVAAQAQPGDWKGIRFEPGTIAASSAMDHAVVEFGSGVDLRGASPTLRNLAIRNNEGPAISIDTASSPLGESLSAEGNGLNGILVTSGVVTGDVIWGLRGIPYVVASGTVEVGSLGFGLVPERLRLVEGVRGSIELRLPEAAPAGGVTVALSSSVPSSVRAPTSATVAEGATRVAIEIEALALGTSVITASRAGTEPARAEVDVVAAPALQLPASLTLNPGEVRTLTLALTERAPDTGLEIALTNSTPAAMTAPAIIRVAPRARSATFDVRGVVSGQTRLAASARGWRAASSDVLVRGRSLILPAQIAVRPGRSKDVTVSVSQPVEGQPLQVTLATSQGGILGLPGMATIAVGQSSVVIQAQGQAAGTVQVTASAAGYESATTSAVVQTLTLSWDVPRISDAGSPVPVAYTPQGFTNSARLRLSRAAPMGGLRVRLRAANPALVAWPVEEIVIPAGQTQAAALVRFSGVAQGLTELIAESDDADEARQALRVGAPLTLRLNNGNANTTLGVGMAARPTVALLSSNQSVVTLLEPVNLSFTSADPLRVEVAGAVSVSAIGQQQPGPLITGRSQTSSAVVVEGQVSGAPINSQLNVVVVVPQVSIWGLQGRLSRGASRDDFQVQLRVDGANAAIQWLVEPVDAQVAVVNASPEGIVPGIFSSFTGGSAISQVRIDAGQSSSPTVFVGTPEVAGTYRLRATVPGIGSFDSDLQQVLVPTLSFGRSRAAIAAGSRTTPGVIRVERRVNGVLSEPGQPVPISIEVSDATKVTASANFTLPPGRSSMDFEFTGLATTSEDVVIRATAAFHDSSPMNVRVVPPTLRITGLDGQRAIGGPRDWFQVATIADDPDAVASGLISPRTISLSLVAANPVDVVAGFFDRFSATGGSPISSVVIPAASSSVAAHVGEGQKIGTYRVRAESAGAATAESGEQRITGTEIAFSVSTAKTAVGIEARNVLYIDRRQDGVLSNAPTPLTVSIANASPGLLGVPATVTIPAFSSRAEIPLTGLSLASDVRLTATAPMVISAATTLVSVVSPRLRVLELDGSRALSSSEDYFQVGVWIGGDQPFGYYSTVSDTLVEVAVVDASPTDVVPGIVTQSGAPLARVTISAGQERSSAAYVGRPRAVGTYRVRATAPGFDPAVSDVQVTTAGRIELESFYTAVGRGFEKDSYFRFVKANGETFYNDTEVTVSFQCVDSSVCSVTPTVVVPPSCEGECNSGGFFILTGLRAGSTQLRASAPGFESVEIDVYVRNPILVEYSGIGNFVIGPTSAIPDLYIFAYMPGDRSLGEEFPYDPNQRQVEDFVLGVVSDSPPYVAIETPQLPGKIRIGPSGWEQPRIVLPTPRVPISAKVTVSGQGLISTSFFVTVE